MIVYFNGFHAYSPGHRHSQCEQFLHNISPGSGLCPGCRHIQCD